MEKKGLYIHIPFCVKKCAYCDFLSFSNIEEEKMDMYIKALIQEMNAIGKSGKIKISTIYIGGGTPSILSVKLFDELMIGVKENFTLILNGEFTVEVNPGVITEEQLESYILNGVNRISIGLQSTEDRLLKELGRIHTYSDFIDSYNRIIKSGIENISVDLMFALSNQTMEEWKLTLEKVIKLKPKHISAYSLIIELDTPYYKRYEEDKLIIPSDEIEREMFWYAHERLEESGYEHYEISNYALSGFESKHNRSYWTLSPYIGVGLGSASYLEGIRYKNETNLYTYIEGKGNLEKIRNIEQEKDLQLELEEVFFLGLRRIKGISLIDIEKKYGKAVLNQYKPIIESLLKEGWVIKNNNYLFLSKKGIDFSNRVLSKFILS